ncbi:MAG: hypothetical protein K0Q76_779 [Panacagrimonas sp.]|jgi:hypothetical protein|nr:hypothetical protein [Panacagrimonas sp.]MCC2655671.1 hypothetical protein [Panacagrimonas sp.]
MKKNKTRVWNPRRPRPPREDRGPRSSDQQAPDDAAAGRDRLIENERQPMDPGVTDSQNA